MSARRLSQLLAALLFVFLVRLAAADEFRPAYLELTQVDAETYDVLWKIPAIDENTTLRIRPAFPAGTETVGAIDSRYANNSAAQRWRVRVPGGLTGKVVSFPELERTRIDVLVRLVRADGTTQLGRVLPVHAQFSVTTSPRAFEVVRTYTVLGITHILTGFDHLAFVTALLILVNGTRRLIATVTAFTLAHSLTLALATLGVVHVPAPPVEALIALSIVFVAAEIIRARQGRPGLSQRYPWVIALVFGLLHGLGFAGALAEIGLPPRSIPLALLCFNVGVELGQLAYIAAVYAVSLSLGSLLRGLRVPRPLWMWRIAPYAIGGLASYWVIERVSAFAH